MYKIGDRVVYPMQGAGTIVDKEMKELLGMEREFFILQMPISNIRISIPVVRNLQIRDMEKGLSTSEKKMLGKTKKMLISELIIVGSLSVEEARDMIDEAITLDENEAPEGGEEE